MRICLLCIVFDGTLLLARCAMGATCAMQIPDGQPTSCGDTTVAHRIGFSLDLVDVGGDAVGCLPQFGGADLAQIEFIVALSDGFGPDRMPLLHLLWLGELLLAFKLLFLVGDAGIIANSVLLGTVNMYLPGSSLVVGMALGGSCHFEAGSCNRRSLLFGEEGGDVASANRPYCCCHSRRLADVAMPDLAGFKFGEAGDGFCRQR
ncbi:hypothetical protein ACLOJK_034326 [Asimina triloba]